MKRKFFKIILLLVVITGVIISGCSKGNGVQKKEVNAGKNQIQAINNEEFLKGVSLSPKSFQAADFTHFFDAVQKIGNAVTWSGDWNELANTQNGGPKVVAELAKSYKYTPIIIAQFFTQTNGQLIRPLDEATKQKYKDSAAAFAKSYQPKYIGLGIEVNILYEKSEKDFNDFALFYNEVYDAVKEVSPETKVFTVFQMEKMKGMNGGLFGGENNPAKGQWQLVNKFKLDLLVFTTYPNLIYKNPTEIPKDYYEEIKRYTDKPVAFTEIGWHSAASPAGWESSESEQREFIENFFELTKGLNKEMVIWSFMYDQKVIEPFNSMGLRDSKGIARPAEEVWAKAK
ncbi:hypothetical protein HYX11_02690 [Candidatus Woesearchaeota archaeon]|nr:hypothetical protein [Candidatus Woesearchaeota archaeon]